MTAASDILARRMRLTRPRTADVICEQDHRATMDDGAVLLADRWVARDLRDQPQPTVLIRSPYGRRQLVGLIFGRLLAERGLQVLIQSVRGTFGSQGVFSPFDERADGLATLRWLREQPWHRDRIGMFGPSYLGLVQWAVATEAGEDLAALAVQVSASQFHGQTYAGGALSLETVASWLVLVGEQERRFAPLATVRGLRKLPALLTETPLTALDERAIGVEVGWYREGLASPGREDAYWVSRDFAAGVAEVSARVQLIGGWYDIFLPWMLEDFAALRAAGQDVQLQIGPWTHTAPGLLAASLRDGLGWLRAHLLDDDRLVSSAPVRVFVTGEASGSRWRDLGDWPPPGMIERRLWLADNRALKEDQPEQESSDRYQYDPIDPTPSLGGPVLLARDPVVDNRELEARPDVLTYTGAPLPAPFEAIGPVKVELSVRASAPHFDIFARVCEVDRNGASWNVCDALVRVAPGRQERSDDGVWLVRFDLWATAHRFAAGHSIRLQISSGAHPRYIRNPGTGADPISATALQGVEIEIMHGGQYRSALVLPGS